MALNDNARPVSREPVVAYVGLGANLGDPVATLKQALLSLAALPLTALDGQSSLYRTAPVDAGGPPYVNAVARLRTRLQPFELLRRLRDIERSHGRERPYRNAPRTLDLDLLTYANLVLDTPRLMLPHPRMHERAFVLVPLLQIDPDLIIPGRGPASALLPGVAGQRVMEMAP